MSRFSNACDRGYDGPSPSEERMAAARRSELGDDEWSEQEPPSYEELEYDARMYKKRFVDEVAGRHRDGERYKAEIKRLEAKIKELEAK